MNEIESSQNVQYQGRNFEKHELFTLVWLSKLSCFILGS